MKSAPKLRRTQAERSASTKAHILETTFECLADFGYAGTTTVKVCERGAISRGALLHHYGTKMELVSATVDYVLERRLSAFEDAVKALPDGVDMESASIDLLWEQFSSRAFYVWLELLVAARTDDALNAATARVGRTFALRARNLHAELFPGFGDMPGGQIMLKIVFAVMNGMAVDRIIPDEVPTEVLLTVLKQFSPAIRAGLSGKIKG